MIELQTDRLDASIDLLQCIYSSCLFGWNIIQVYNFLLLRAKSFVKLLVEVFMVLRNFANAISCVHLVDLVCL